MSPVRSLMSATYPCVPGVMTPELPSLPVGRNDRQSLRSVCVFSIKYSGLIGAKQYILCIQYTIITTDSVQPRISGQNSKLGGIFSHTLWARIACCCLVIFKMASSSRTVSKHIVIASCTVLTIFLSNAQVNQPSQQAMTHFRRLGVPTVVRGFKYGTMFQDTLDSTVLCVYQQTIVIGPAR